MGFPTKVKWSWKESFRFALAEKFLLPDDSLFKYHKNRLELFGTFFLKPLYKAFGYIAGKIRKPIAIFLFTLLAAVIAILVFYNISALAIFGKLFPSKTIRLLLFIYIEFSFFCIGCRSIGRFNNENLISRWKDGKLVPMFPGDQKSR